MSWNRKSMWLQFPTMWHSSSSSEGLISHWNKLSRKQNKAPHLVSQARSNRSLVKLILEAFTVIKRNIAEEWFKWSSTCCFLS
ncbi:hypothetical protein O9929_22245 [Vibrio lentus]|nr:hypothetical protein [Vibrio lentus]